MPYPLPNKIVARADRILSRLAQQRMSDAGVASLVRDTAALPSGLRRENALYLLDDPNRVSYLARMDQALADHGLAVHGPSVGAGASSLVFDATRIGDPSDQHVIKIAANPEKRFRAEDFFDLPDIPGSAPYWLKGEEGDLVYGVQPKARLVYRPARPGIAGDEMWWKQRTQDLYDNLSDRGYVWRDSHHGNIGVRNDTGDFAVIDGTVVPFGVPKVPDGYISPKSVFRSAEDAIRALRFTQDQWRGSP